MMVLPSRRKSVRHHLQNFTGAITGKWSYDEATKRLTLGNVVVCVERELDWEANPRRETIVYAGVDKNNKVTYWGKKI